MLNANELMSTYIKDCILLVKSLQIKNHDIAIAMNEALVIKFGAYFVDPINLSSWRYYLHLAGMPLDTVDVPMYVESLDTTDTIEFNKENLAIHIATRREYATYGKKYDELCLKYKDQEVLIRGILNPYALDKAVAARNYAILSHEKSLVEEQEATLIYDLDNHVENYSIKWGLRPYKSSDSLFVAASFAVLALNIVPMVFNLRLKRAKTNEAHSFHIKNFLASNHNLDEVYPYYTTKQAMFLYRNLPYIDNHVGLNETFYWLIERLLTERGISVHSYTFMQNEGQDEGLQQNYSFVRRWLNLPYNSAEVNKCGLDHIRDIEIPTAAENEKFYEAEMSDLDLMFKNTKNSVKFTKDIESVLVDYTDSVPIRFLHVLINHMAYTAHIGKYRAVVVVADKISGITYHLKAVDAFKLLTYISHLRLGVPIENFGVYRCERIVDATLTEEKILEVSPKRNNEYKRITQALYDRAPSYSSILSNFSFFDFVKDVYLMNLGHWIYTSNVHSMWDNGYIKNMTNRVFEDRLIDFFDGRSVEEWRAVNNIPDMSDYSFLELNTVFTSVIDVVTDNRLKEIFSLKDTQTAMIETMRRLTSYSVQFVESYTKTNLMPAGLNKFRTSVANNIQKTKNRYELPLITATTRISVSESLKVSSLTSDIFFYLTSVTGHTKHLINLIAISLRQGTKINEKLIVRFNKGFLPYRGMRTAHSYQGLNKLPIQIFSPPIKTQNLFSDTSDLASQAQLAFLASVNF